MQKLKNEQSNKKFININSDSMREFTHFLILQKQ
jgi:hypothetical protein